MKKITLLIILLVGMVAFAQFPQDFEGTFPPPGWITYRGTDDLGTVEDWSVSKALFATGTQSAYVNYEAVTDGTAEDWLVSPSYTVTAPNTNLAFFQAQEDAADYGSVYTIRVSTTSQTDIASFTIVDTQTETDFSTVMSPRTVDLSAYLGKTIYIAFVMENNEGDSWAVDGVDFIGNLTPPDCASNPEPFDGASNISVGEVTFSWTAPAGSTASFYNVYYGTDANAVDTFLGTFNTLPINLSLTSFDATFYWKVVPVNFGGAPSDCTAWSFTTESNPGYCLAATNGQYPDVPFTTTTCDGTTDNVIATDCYAGEYSMVNVISGNTYKFSSGDTDFITLSNEAGNTSIIAGITPITWVANFSGAIRFYTHVDDQCGDEQVERTRSIICSDPNMATNTFANDGFVTFPNPVNAILNISYTKNISKVALFNLLGQEVITKSLNQNQSQIDMSNLSRGTYMLKVTADNQVKTIKVIKE